MALHRMVGGYYGLEVGATRDGMGFPGVVGWRYWGLQGITTGGRRVLLGMVTYYCRDGF